MILTKRTSKTIRIAPTISTSSGRRTIQNIVQLVYKHLQKKNYVMTTCSGGKNKHEIVYVGLNVQMLKALLAHKKKLAKWQDVQPPPTSEIQ